MKGKSKIAVSAAVIVLLVPLILLVTTGFHYVPVSLTIGTCMKDYTSPSTYAGERLSPLDEVYLEIGNKELLICYGRPSARDRKVFGGIVPYGELWRTGANEPTRMYTTADLKAGDLQIPPGRYSIYSIPGVDNWQFFISRSTYHWGNAIGQHVRQQEVGSITVAADTTSRYVEKFTINTESVRDDSLHIHFLWENTKLTVPVVISE